MDKMCSPVCQTCLGDDFVSGEQTKAPPKEEELKKEEPKEVDPEAAANDAKCSLSVSLADNVWHQGDLNKFFMGVVTNEKYQQYNPTVLSAPEYLPGDTKATAGYMVDGPWIVMLDDVISKVESSVLIDLGTEEGFKASYAEGEVSSNESPTVAWCKGDCYEDPLVQKVVQRLADITDLPGGNSEWFQLVKYENGQFYDEHSDFVQNEKDKPAGVRILTVYLFLDDVETGGEANFPALDITVTPKRGSALIWPNVRDGNPNSHDYSTVHQTLPVENGVKYGANFWYHMRDYQTPAESGCV